MHTMHIKNWFHHKHILNSHLENLHISRIVHNQRFLAAVILAAVLIIFTILVIIAVRSGGGNAGENPFFYGRDFPYYGFP